VKPISLDLRQRILAALKEEGSSLVVAKRFRVGASSVRKLRLQMLRTGSFEPGTAPGRERLVQGQDEERLLRLVRAYPDATLNVLRELLLDETGVSVSETTMWRQLERMGITLKKRPSARPNKTDRT
jgi:transposase